MTTYRLLPDATAHLTDIYIYTQDEWGQKQADSYLNDFYDFFEAIVSKDVMWRPIPAEFNVSGYFGRCNKHFVYWKKLGNGDVGIAAILHKRRHQIAWLREVFDLDA